MAADMLTGGGAGVIPCAKLRAANEHFDCNTHTLKWVTVARRLAMTNGCFVTAAMSLLSTEVSGILTSCQRLSVLTTK